MKGLLLIRRLWPELKHNPLFHIDYTVEDVEIEGELLLVPESKLMWAVGWSMVRTMVAVEGLVNRCTI